LPRFWRRGESIRGLEAGFAQLRGEIDAALNRGKAVIGHNENVRFLSHLFL
jgi:hypothetical protein